MLTNYIKVDYFIKLGDTFQTTKRNYLNLTSGLWKIQLWCYHRIQQYTEYKALMKGLKVIYVDARNTSKTPPIKGKLTFLNYRWVKLPNSIVTTRDIVTSWNLALRGLKQMRV